MFNDFVHFCDLIHYNPKITVPLDMYKNFCLFYCKYFILKILIAIAVYTFLIYMIFTHMRRFIVVSSRFIAIHITGKILHAMQDFVCMYFITKNVLCLKAKISAIYLFNDALYKWYYAGLL